MNGRRELTFFTDRDLGHRFAQLLLTAGVRVERHDDHFQPTTPDDEWIGAVGRRGPQAGEGAKCRIHSVIGRHQARTWLDVAE